MELGTTWVGSGLVVGRVERERIVLVGVLALRAVLGDERSRDDGSGDGGGDHLGGGADAVPERLQGRTRAQRGFGGGGDLDDHDLGLGDVGLFGGHDCSPYRGGSHYKACYFCDPLQGFCVIIRDCDARNVVFTLNVVEFQL